MLSSLFKRRGTVPNKGQASTGAMNTSSALSSSSGLSPALEARTVDIGRNLLEAARGNQAGLLSKAFWQDKLMNWSMKDQAFKVQLFRFVDTFPALRDPEAVHEHLVDYLTQPGVTLPPGLGLGLAAGGLGGLTKGMMTRTMTSQIEGMAKNFIAGTDAKSALPVLRDLWKREIAFSVDLLGEACVSEAEVEAYRKRYLDLIETLPGDVSEWETRPMLESDHLGAIPRVNVSIKISALSVKTDPADFEKSVERTFESIRPILEAAKRRGVLVNFDMEHHGLKELTLALFWRCCERIDFEAGIAMQAYLRSGDGDARRMIEWAKRTGRMVTVRLVKGAYWDFETIYADQQGWPCPVWGSKRDTDACFERMSKLFVDAMPTKAGEPGVKLALGSHNLRSIASVLAMVEARGLPTSAVELQMLHGMADALKGVMVGRKLRLREYVPVGEMIPGMAYLVRRLLENTSNESWLRAGFLDEASFDALLASPHGQIKADSTRDERSARHGLSDAPAGVGDGRPFFTEPMRDFAERHQREAFASAVARAVVPKVPIDATVDQMNSTVARAANAFPAWRALDVRERAACLVRAADIMRRRRDDLSGVIIRENEKNWRNADADVCEAIDFCEYYAREAIRLFEPGRLGRFSGELNEVFYQPRGVCGVIAPWNFPLAIACGMTVAALVTGNTAVLKPAEQTPGIAKELADILWEAGVPRDVLGFVSGPGETVGAGLVRHPSVKLIAFTGSRDVGLDILSAAAPPSPFGYTGTLPTDLKKVVCEMGGKNAIIIDTSADLDEAVLGVRESAFGFSGQKCSACSRVIVVESVYETFVSRLVESTKCLVVGDPTDPGTDMGPVIDDAAAEKIRQYVELGKKQNRLAYGLDKGGRLIGPHIFVDVKSDNQLATDEIFGPVLAVIRVKDFAEAISVANHSAYKLTGGVYTRKPSNLALARREFRVGNLYLNRGITGALVGRQPFGGFGMSGVGSKAGGRDYLLQFVEPRVVTENTMRRGFAPET